MSKGIGLRDKFFGCICGVPIGSAMGAAVENMSYQEIESNYGTLNELLPYKHYGNGSKEPLKMVLNVKS
jgi:ADP-ribosylglycohydrolase